MKPMRDLMQREFNYQCRIYGVAMKPFLVVFSMLICIGINCFSKGVCAWSNGGCTSIVYQRENSFLLIVGCSDGTGGVWVGKGQWGGNCPTTWYGASPCRTGLGC